MADYDFHQLSPSDFEEMCRDLLDADFGLKLESFKTGRDGGIDFRYARAGEKLIVQCKHYLRTGLPGLLRDLRKEVAKVRTLSPTRYILVTSVALSPHNKDEIIAAIGADVLPCMISPSCHLYVVGFWPHRGQQHLYLAAENRTFNSARTGSIY